MNSLRIYATALCTSVAIMIAPGQELTKTGTTAAQFLKIGVGPRAVGMGGAFTATADDITAIYWNPGGLAAVAGNEAFFNHVAWFADMKYDFAAVAVQFPGFGTLGTFVTVLSMDQMLVRTVEKPEGTGEYFGAGALAVGLDYSRNLTDNFAIGFNAKYIREYIWNSSSVGVAFDVGTIYRIPILNEFRLAASICNFGTKMKLQGRDNLVFLQTGPGGANSINADIQLDEFDLPLLFRVGVAADVIKTGESRVTTAVDAIHPNDNTESVNMGLECAWNEMLFLRAGMKSLFEEETEQGITLGTGLSYRVVEGVKVKIDYAYEDFGRLKNVHYFSLGVRF